MYSVEEKNNNALVVVGYNRPLSLKRILTSLTNAYYSEPVTLILSIDKSGNEEVYQLAENFEWQYGKKYVVIQEKRRGLKEHIYRCGDLSQYFKSVTILEDDLYVSPFFYQYIKQTVEKYGDDDNIAGISLYRNEYNGYNQLPLTFLNIGHDVFAYQSTSTWGETFTWQMWSKFRKWLGEWNGDFDKVDMYQTIKNWERAWSKYFEAYLVLNNKYFIYPYISVSTNNNDAGEHVSTSEINNTWQTELLYGERNFILPDFDQLMKYDTYAQCEKLKELLGIENLAIDLNGNRENVKDVRYLLSIRHQNTKIIRSYGLRFRPIELNIILNTSGKDIYLYDQSEYEKNTFDRSVDTMLTEFYLREFNEKMIKKLSPKLHIKWLKNFLRRCIRKLNTFIVN